MPRLSLLPSAIEIEVRMGARLTEAIRAAGLPIAAPCGDDLICAKCAVRIVSGAVAAESRIETEMKQRNRVPSDYRLACALRVRSDLVVTTDYWGDAQSGGTSAAASSEASSEADSEADSEATSAVASGAPSRSGESSQGREAPLRAWLLLDHGSRLVEAHSHLAELAAELGRRSPERAVYVAHMELAEPSLAATIARCAQEGVKRLDLYPLFLAPGRHVLRDLPNQIEQAQSAYPEMQIRVLPSLGSQPDFVDWVLESLLRADELP